MCSYKKLTILCLVCILVLFAGAGCTREEEKKGDVLTFTLSSDGTCYEAVAERANNLTTQAITVPSTYGGKPVAIPAKAFYGLPALTSVIIESAVGRIDSQAFMNCPLLETVVLKGDASVEKNCFRGCESLKSITFGEGIQSIGEECVVDCPALETIIIGDDCTSIEAKAFRNCKNLVNVSLGNGLEMIGPYAFAYTSNLKQIRFPEGKPLMLADFAFSYSGLEEIRLPANVTMGEYVFNHLAWNEDGGYSMCRAVYFYALEPTVEGLGTNAIGYTWDRNEGDDPQLGAFKVYVPAGTEDVYRQLMAEECDESWTRCVLNAGKLDVFVP